MRPRDGYLSSDLKLIARVWPRGTTSVRNQQKIGASMNFTVARAVRGSDLNAPRPSEGLGRLSRLPAPPRSPAAMDLPYADEVLHLEISDFPKTVPGRLD